MLTYFPMISTEATPIATQLCQKKFYNIGSWLKIAIKTKSEIKFNLMLVYPGSSGANVTKLFFVFNLRIL